MNILEIYLIQRMDINAKPGINKLPTTTHQESMIMSLLTMISTLMIIIVEILVIYLVDLGAIL